MQTKPYQAEELQHRVSHETVIRCNEPLAKRTTLRVGGPADLYIEPAGDADLVAILKFCVEKKMPFFVLGRGSNLLVKDRGFRGAAISLAHQAFSGIEFEGQRLRCGAGAKLKTVSVEAKRHDLTGLEFLEGIPGTLGGALRMNAGAMGSAIFDFVESVRLIDFHGNMFERTRKELDVSYRQCSSLRTHIALGAVLHCQPAPRELIERRDLLRSATEEFLRYGTPTQGLGRTVSKDVEFHGQQLKAGDRVMLMWAASNRDPAEFEDPDTIDIERHPNRHMAFGVGLHRCLGSNLARTMFQVMLYEILNRLPDFELTVDQVPRFDNASNVYAPTAFPVRFTPGPRMYPVSS